jgi:hypothetical protein
MTVITIILTWTLSVRIRIRMMTLMMTAGAHRWMSLERTSSGPSSGPTPPSPVRSPANTTATQR